MNRRRLRPIVVVAALTIAAGAYFVGRTTSGTPSESDCMISDEDFEAYMLSRAITQPSIDSIRPDFPRWRKFAAMMGVYTLDPLVQNKVVNLLINQASPLADSATKHRLRNENGIRPPKP